MFILNYDFSDIPLVENFLDFLYEVIRIYGKFFSSDFCGCPTHVAEFCCFWEFCSTIAAFHDITLDTSLWTGHRGSYIFSSVFSVFLGAYLYGYHLVLITQCVRHQKADSLSNLKSFAGCVSQVTRERMGRGLLCLPRGISSQRLKAILTGSLHISKNVFLNLFFSWADHAGPGIISISI